jgi:hypothetical protein
MWQPLIVDSVFTEDERHSLLDTCDYLYKFRGSYDSAFGRITSGDDRLLPYLHSSTYVARDVFGIDCLLPTYALWSKYDVPQSNLHKHKDDNACTYTLDYCLRQREPWDIYVEGVPYTLQEDQALAFMGEDQEHWRPDFSKGNVVEMIFFHFVTPDHWFFNPDAPPPERFSNHVCPPIPEL